MRQAISILAVAALLVGLSARQVGGQVRHYAGRPLPDVLTELNGAGLALVFSSRVVRFEMTVRVEPRATDPRGVLDEILAPHGLRVVGGPGGRLLVVHALAAREALPGDASHASPPGSVSIGFRRPGSQRLLVASSVDLAGARGTATVAASGRIVIRGLPPGLHYLETAVPGFVDPEARAFSVTTDGAVDFVIDLDPLPEAQPSPIATLPPVRLLVTAGVRLVETMDVSDSVDRDDVGPPVTRLPAGALAGTAGTFDNPLRTVQTLPGVSSAWTFDSRLIVRGGAPTENLVLVDGVENYSPYRVFGLASAFVPGTLESIELRSGGFDVRHGDRLSSVVLVNNRDGRRSAKLAGTGGFGLLDADLVLEGALPGTRDGSWLAGGRYTFYDLVAGSVLRNKMPRDIDVHAKVSVGAAAGHRLSLFGAVGDERMDGHEVDDPSEDFTMRTRSRAVLTSARLDSMLGARATLSSTVSLTSVRDLFDLRGAVKTDARGVAGFSPGNGGGIVGVVYDKTVTVRDWAVREDLTFQASPRHVLEAGVEAHALATGWHWRVGGDRSEDVSSRMLPWPYAIPGANLPSRLDSRLAYMRAGAWLQYRPAVGEWLAPQVGVRLDSSGLTRATEVSPRASVTARLGAATRLTAAAGVYRQSPGYEKQFQSDYFVDLSQRDRLRSERALHAVIGIGHTPTAGVTVGIDAYRKWYTNLLVGRLETESERAARLARYDFGSLTSQVASAPRVTVVPSNEGRGDARGFELYAEKTQRAGDPRLTARLSYSFGIANRTVYGRTVPFDYDRRHALNLVAGYQVRPSIALSGAIRLASGLPYTAPVGVRVAARMDADDRDGDGNRQELVPARDSAGALVYALDFGDFSNVNRARLPRFARVDARVTFSPHGPVGRWSVYLDVVNLLGRDNPGLITSRVDGTPRGVQPVITAEPDYSLPFLPSVGLRFRF